MTPLDVELAKFWQYVSDIECTFQTHPYGSQGIYYNSGAIALFQNERKNLSTQVPLQVISWLNRYRGCIGKPCLFISWQTLLYSSFYSFKRNSIVHTKYTLNPGSQFILTDRRCFTADSQDFPFQHRGIRQSVTISLFLIREYYMLGCFTVRKWNIAMCRRLFLLCHFRVFFLGELSLWLS